MKKQLLLFMMVLLPMVASAHDFAAKNADGVYIYYVWIKNNTELAVSYEGTSYSTTYSNNDYYGDVVIPESVYYYGTSYPVTEIRYGAFSGCSNLTSVTIPNSITKIGYQAFYKCSGLTSVTIPNSVTEIESQTFYNCTALSSIEIPNSVSIIEGGAFQGTAWYDNQLDGLVYAGRVAYKYKGTMPANTSIIINDGTISVSSSAFSGFSNLTNITIPNSVISIGSSAFASCSGLTSITIPNSVTSIGSSAFYNCSGLTSITLPNSITSIGYGAFEACNSLTSVTIPNKVTSIEFRTFYKCSGLISITIPNSVTSIGAGAFARCSSLTSVTIPNSVTSIANGNYDKVDYYGAFSNCTSLTSITLSNSLLSIGDYTFYNCSYLTSITIPDGVTSIGDYAFNSCSGLISATIPNSVTSIGYRSFYYCSSLTSITIPDGVTSIGDDAFYHCSGLTSATIPNSVTSIGKFAFYYCSGLTSVTIPSSVTSIGSWAFTGCSSLKSINIPNGVTSIDDGVFSSCSSLTSITIPDGVTSIGSTAFMTCSCLTSITIPDGVTNIGENAFKGCSNIETLRLPENLQIIRKSAFQNCYSLATLTIPASVEYIYQEAFAGCSALTQINVQPTTPPFLYNNSFSYFNVPVNVPNGCVDTYRAAQGWSNFTNITDGNLNYQITVNVGNNGSVTYGTETVTNGSEIFNVKDGNDAVLTITPATGYQVSTLTVNGEDVKSQLTNGILTISNVTSNKTVEVTFELIPGYTESIKMSVPSGDRTAIGYSSSLGLDFTGIEDVKAWIVTGFTDDANVLLSRVRIVPPYTGLYLTSNVAGIEVDVPTTDKDIYYANLLKAAVEEETIQPTEMHDNVEFTNFVVGKLTSGEMGFVRVKTARTLGPNKSRLLVPSSYYPVANAAREFNVEFLDDDATTDIKGKEAVRQTANQLYDLQGRMISVSQARKGIYIYKGKKYVIK